MGTYNFRWAHPATEVYVTGTFDNWSRSVKLDQRHLVHEKLVGLPAFEDKIFFKYVVDGEWKLDSTHPTEEDHRGNTNNVLYPDELGPPMPGAHPVISSVGPGASTAAMAGQQPLQRRQTEDVSDVPGAFPETPAPTAGEDEKKDGLAAAAGVGGIAAVGAAVLGTAASKNQQEEQTFSVNPLPATEGAGNPIHLAPGEKVPDPSTFTQNTIQSTVRDSAAPEEQTFSVNPIPASDGPGNPIHLAPGEKVPDPSTFNPNTIQSTVRDAPEPEESTFSVAPIPATGGIGNPIKLAPGEKVPDPSTITGNTIQSTVKLDPESYARSDAGAPQLPPVVTPPEERSAGGLIPGFGAQTGGLIPESSLPMGADVPAPIDQADLGPHISSVGPTSTTAQLAGQVPLEPRGVPNISSIGKESTTASLAGQVPLEPRGVPQIVEDSQQQAHAAPEASANPVAVQEKKEVEDELKSKVPEDQSSGDNKAGIAAAVGGGLAAVGAAAATTAAVLRQKTHETTGTDPVSILPQSIQDSINNINSSTDKAGTTATTNAAAAPVSTTDASRATASNVPAEVKESQKAAHVDPEASANPEAVREKSALENELLRKVPESQAVGQPAPTAAAATSATAPSPAPQLSTVGPAPQLTTSGAPQIGNPIVGGGISPILMDEKSDAAATGAAATGATGAATPGGLNAPASAPATVDAQTGKPAISRDVSPKSKPTTAGQTEPTVTTGVGSSAAPTTSTPGHKKRHSLFGGAKASGELDRPGTAGTDGAASHKKKGLLKRIKEKFSHHH